MTRSTDPLIPWPRSAAASAASRRNGAKSRGPKSAAGKARAARNALRHGLRASDPVLPETMPTWMPTKLADLETALGDIGQTRREHLDRYALHLVLIEKVDRLIAAEFARVFAISDGGNELRLAAHASEIDLSQLRALFGYRRRFRAARDRSLVKLATQGPWLKQLRAAERKARTDAKR